MRCIAVLVVTVLALAQTDERGRKEEDNERAYLECQADPETRISEEADPNSQAASFLCVGVKLGTMKPNGDVNPEGFRKFLMRSERGDAALVDKIVAECSKRHGDTAEQAAMGLMGCINKCLKSERN